MGWAQAVSITPPVSETPPAERMHGTVTLVEPWLVIEVGEIEFAITSQPDMATVELPEKLTAWLALRSSAKMQASPAVV
jgi:hypothetical protein